MNYPSQLRYTETHEWLRVEDDEVVVGITGHAVEQLGDIVFVELPDTDTEVEKGKRFGEIESTKTVSDLNAPVSGVITGVNKDLEDRLETLQQSPYEAGWMVRIRPKDRSEIDSLLSAADYGEHVAAEDH